MGITVKTKLKWLIVVLVSLLGFLPGITWAFPAEHAFTNKDVFFQNPFEHMNETYVLRVDAERKFTSTSDAASKVVVDGDAITLTGNARGQKPFTLTGKLYACFRSPSAPAYVSWDKEGATPEVAALLEMATIRAAQACTETARLIRVL